MKFYLELVIHSKILLPVKVSHGDLQLIIFLAGQSVEVFKAKPTLSLKMVIAYIHKSGKISGANFTAQKNWQKKCINRDKQSAN